MRLRKVLDTALTSRALQDFQQRPTESPFSTEAMSQVREALALEFNTTATHRGYEKGILQSVLEQSHDLDAKVIPRWLNEGFPLGIIHPIPHTGIFPQTEDVSDAIRMSALCGRVVKDWDGTALNYESFYQAGEKAQHELDRMLAEGWAEIVPTWAQVVQLFGPEARLTSIACIIKQSHGKEKVRLVVDMRRSSVNGLMTVKERVVLPRVSDVAKSVQALAYSDSHLLELLCIDFKDAFYTMPAHPDERGYLVVKDTQGRYICIKVCAFGLASAPLLWCRLAACVMRLAQATHHDWECRISCYVDDPIVVACGQSSMDRTRVMLRSVLLWAVLGFKLSWGKVLRGFDLDWIGVKLAVPRGLPRTFEVELAEDKVEKLKEALHGLLDQPMIPVKVLQRTTGILGWLSSIIPEVRPWLAMLWAVLTQALQQEGPKRLKTRERKGLVFRKQLEHAARCLLALLTNLAGPSLKHTYRQPQDTRWYTLKTGHGGRAILHWKAAHVLGRCGRMCQAALRQRVGGQASPTAPEEALIPREERAWGSADPLALVSASQPQRRRPGAPMTPHTEAASKRRRGSAADALAIASSDKATQTALDTFQGVVYAPGTPRAKSALFKLWCDILSARGLPPLPVDTEKLSIVSSVLRAAGFKSAPAYLYEAKDCHMRAGHAWTDALNIALRDCRRGLTRGLGPPCRALEIEPCLWSHLPENPETQCGLHYASMCGSSGRASASER